MSEINAAPVLFPVAVARWVCTLSSANFAWAHKLALTFPRRRCRDAGGISRNVLSRVLAARIKPGRREYWFCFHTGWRLENPLI